MTSCPPGGNGAGMRDRSFGRESREQLALEPGFRALAAALRQMSGPGHRPETPGHRPHLPSGPVPAEYLLRGELRCREGGEDDHVSGDCRRLRLRGLAAPRLQRDPDRRRGFPDHAETSGGGGGRPAAIRGHIPGADGSRAVRAGDCRRQVEPVPVRPQEGRRAGIDPDHDIPAGCRHAGDAGSLRAAAISDQAITGRDREAPERLAGAGALGPRHRQVIADRLGKAHAVVNAPRRAGLPRLLHRGCIHGADLRAGPCAIRRRHALGKQCPARRQQPGTGSGQALHQRHR